jgi:hypothetical protein
MARTNSYSEARDYIEYVQSADPRRLPGEALKIIKRGIAAGKLIPSDPFVTDAKTMASPRACRRTRPRWSGWSAMPARPVPLQPR